MADLPVRSSSLSGAFVKPTAGATPERPPNDSTLSTTSTDTPKRWTSSTRLWAKMLGPVLRAWRYSWGTSWRHSAESRRQSAAYTRAHARFLMANQRVNRVCNGEPE